jgi:hypothetical protein
LRRQRPHVVARCHDTSGILVVAEERSSKNPATPPNWRICRASFLIGQGFLVG